MKRVSSNEQTYLVTTAFDGTNYVGWQMQPNGVSVQQVFQEGFEQITGEPVKLRAAGRTDAGVHALALPADFTVRFDLDLDRLVRSWDAVTPRDVSVMGLRHVPQGFNARFAARRRTYRYMILNRPRPSPFLARWCWHIPFKLDINAMQEAIASLIGEHDFSTFRAADCKANHPVRRIFATKVSALGNGGVCALPAESVFAGGVEEGLLAFAFIGSAFLKHQVRSMIGTLVEVGRGKMTAARFADILAAAKRELAGPTAPAHGLTLAGVEFDETELSPPPTRQ